MLRRLHRYGEVYAIMLRNSMIREMAFKANFLLWMGVELLWFIGQIIFIEVIFGYVDRIGDWTKWEVVLLVGTHQLIAQIFQAFFYSNLANLPELIRTGRLDFMLLQPIDTQFAVSTKQFGLDNLINALIGIAFVATALLKLAIVPTPAQIALYLVAIGMGVIIHYSILLCLAATSFWIVRSQGLIYGYYSLFNLGRYPDVIFRGLFKFVFSWIIPIIVVTNIPTRLLIRAADSPAPLLLHLLLATVIVTIATRLFWRAALRRYASASS
jgi:ABC-2 type transport system permease protein